MEGNRSINSTPQRPRVSRLVSWRQFTHAARAVCKIQTRKSSGTGFVVGPMHILTNSHLLPTIEACNGSFAEFHTIDKVIKVALDPESCFINSPVQPTPLRPPSVDDFHLDYTLVQFKLTKAMNTICQNPIAFMLPTNEQPRRVEIIQHPGGGEKAFASGENRVVYVTDLVVRFAAKIRHGSSGSPVLVHRDETLVLYALARGTSAGFYEGIRIDAIMRDIALHQSFDKISTWMPDIVKYDKERGREWQKQKRALAKSNFQALYNKYSLDTQSLVAQAVHNIVLSSHTDVELSGARIEIQGIGAIGQAIELSSTITRLNLWSNNLSADAGNAIATALWSTSSLKELHLGSNHFTDSGATPIGRALAHNSTLTVLSLWNNMIGIEGGRAIGDGLKANSSLTVLDLGANPLQDAGIDTIVQALISNCSLKELDLKNTGIGVEGGRAIAKALTNNTRLCTLNVGNWMLEPIVKRTQSQLQFLSNNLTCQGGIDIGQALKQNSSLTSLNLAGNNLGNKGAIAIAEGVQKNPLFTDLSLAENEIDAQGVCRIAKLLEYCFLTFLDLSGNKLRDQGAMAIANWLPKALSLTSLNLGLNKIGDKGASALGQALQKTSSLTSLGLQCNEIGNVDAFLNALNQKCSLTEFNLFLNLVDDRGLSQIESLLHRKEQQKAGQGSRRRKPGD